MNVTDIFIKRPVLSTVVSLVITIVGLQALFTLNVRQYPRSDNAVGHGHHRLCRCQRRAGARLYHYSAGAGHRRGRRDRLH
jgi:hypothetical protein